MCFYGVDGEIFVDLKIIIVYNFNMGQSIIYNIQVESLGYGGGDVGLIRQFVMVVDMVKNYGWFMD